MYNNHNVHVLLLSISFSGSFLFVSVVSSVLSLSYQNYETLQTFRFKIWKWSYIKPQWKNTTFKTEDKLNEERNKLKIDIRHNDGFFFFININTSVSKYKRYSKRDVPHKLFSWNVYKKIPVPSYISTVNDANLSLIGYRS